MGAVISIYIPMISQSARIMRSTVMGNVPYFAVAFATSVIIALLSGQRGEAFACIGISSVMVVAGAALVTFGAAG